MRGGGYLVGAVSVETYNAQLMELADYGSKKRLKQLYRNMDNLYALSECGDMVAASIYIDLKTALESDFLTLFQVECIREHLVNKAPLKELASILNKSPSTIYKAVTGGLANVQRALLGGDLYAR